MKLIDRRAATLSLCLALAALASPSGPASAQSAAEKALAETGALPENSFGDPKAPVTVIEYASLTCHHCQNFHLNTWPAVKAKYVDTGKVQFVMREFPNDPLATGGFMLARCAGEKRWYGVVDMLYRNDDRWAHASDPLDGLKGLMRQMGMGSDSVDACLGDQKLLDDIRAVRDRGEKAGVSATPTFFVNGRKSSGMMSIEQFSALIDPILAANQ